MGRCGLKAERCVRIEHLLPGKDGGVTAKDQAIGRSRGGQSYDLVDADDMLPDMQADLLFADKAYDVDERGISMLADRQKAVVNQPKANRRIKCDYDRDVYKIRHLIENFFAKLEQFRAITTRYEKPARNFLAGIHLAATAIWLK